MFSVLTPIEERRKIYTGYQLQTSPPSELIGQKPIQNIRRNPYNEVPLEKALDVSYEPNLQKAQQDLNPYGYRIDPELSSHETKVFFNPYSNKMIYSVAGTDPKNLRDLGTDAYLAFLGSSGLKQTNRYKEATVVLDKAREKYKTAKRVLVGHSLGASIISNLAKPSEQVLTFGKGSGVIPVKNAPREVALRTFYDPLSFTSSAKSISLEKPTKRGNLRAQQQGIVYYGAHSYKNLPDTFTA